MILLVDRFYIRSTQGVVHRIAIGESILIHQLHIQQIIPRFGAIITYGIGKAHIGAHGECTTWFSKLVVVNHTHRSLDLILKTKLLLLTIIDAYAITVVDILTSFIRFTV